MQRITSGSTSPQRGRHPHGPYFQDPSIGIHQQRWRPFVHPQPYMYPYPPNGFRRLCLLFSTHMPGCSTISCTECCCDFEDDSSIYYIPTTARAVHPEGVYQHTSYTYSVPRSVVNGGPPNYLSIAGPPPVPSYAGEYVRTHVNHSRSRRARRVSDVGGIQ
ncbi:unnamed protein product [Heligmosomoides polygyrus]|uniref:Uncharacterized protein n=1 Tax=Heligmosomoides polygyrus TaxID=6339 RepID=A0A3P8FFZ0_HELPZ|nr:unnamed protein product [Heligmosomoides polygyrus]